MRAQNRRIEGSRQRSWQYVVKSAQSLHKPEPNRARFLLREPSRKYAAKDAQNWPKSRAFRAQFLLYNGL